jgi:hypothetical protein
MDKSVPGNGNIFSENAMYLHGIVMVTRICKQKRNQISVFLALIGRKYHQDPSSI